MKENLKNQYEDIKEFFLSEPTANQRAWGIIHDFYHIILTYMEKKKISKADLARRLGKSRASITQMFNKTPNLTIKKMIEIADAIGINIKITAEEIEKLKNKENIKQIKIIYMPLNVPINWQQMETGFTKSKYKEMEITADSSIVTHNYEEFRPY